MVIKIKKKYWWINYQWNNGETNYLYKFKKKRKLLALANKFKKKIFIKWKRISIAHLVWIFKHTLKWQLFKTRLVFNIIRSRRNIFLNLSTLNGRVIKATSCGCFFKKGSERRTFLAFKEVLSKLNWSLIIKHRPIILRIRASNYYKAGFKRNLKLFLKTTTWKFNKYITIKFKAHNGVRRRKQRRK